MTLLLRDAASGQTWSLVDGRLVIGRKNAPPPADRQVDDVLVLLDDGLVSRAHAVIRTEDGHFTVTDTDSRDGTYVNDHEVTETTRLHDGDRLRVGDTVLVASIEHTVPPPPSRRVDSEQTLFQTPSRPQLLDADRTLYQAPPPLPASPIRSERSTQERVAPLPATPRPTTPRPPGMGPASVNPRPIQPPPAGTGQPSSPPTGPVVVASTVPPPAPPDPVPAHVVVTVPTEASALTPRLPELRRSANRLAAALSEFDQELATALDLFERNGGHAAAQTFLAHARRIAAEPRTAEDLQAFFSWLPSGCRLLEAELIVMNLLSSWASDAPR